MSEAVALRRAESADDSAIASILDAGRRDIPLDDAFSLPRILDWLSIKRADLDAWVIVAAGQVVAVAVLEGTDIAYVAAAADLRRRGFGRKLVRHAKRMAVANAWPALTAKAKASNTKVIALLKDEGFGFDREATEASPWPERHWQHYRWSNGKGRPSGHPNSKT